MCRLFDLGEFVDLPLTHNTAKRQGNADSRRQTSSVAASMICFYRLTLVNDGVFSGFNSPKFCAIGAEIARET